jgi:hypothetical protein
MVLIAIVIIRIRNISGHFCLLLIFRVFVATPPGFYFGPILTERCDRSGHSSGKN